MFQIDKFTLTKSDFADAVTVLSCFRTEDGSVFIECENRLSAVADKLGKTLDGKSEISPLTVATTVDDALNVFGALYDVCAEPDSLKLIADCSLDKIKYIPADDTPRAVLLTCDMEYPEALSDIKLGVEYGCVAYGVVKNGTVCCAAYTFCQPEENGAVEIGVETVEDEREKGYAKASVFALSTHLLARDVKPLYSFYCDNAPSRRIVETLGFVCHATGFEVVMKRRTADAV